MFGGRKTKKLEKALENAAVELTIAEKLLGPPPGGHGPAQAAIVKAARAASATDGAAVAEIMAAADDHPDFRGDDKQAWLDFVAGARAQI